MSPETKLHIFGRVYSSVGTGYVMDMIAAHKDAAPHETAWNRMLGKTPARDKWKVGLGNAAAKEWKDFLDNSIPLQNWKNNPETLPDDEDQIVALLVEEFSVFLTHMRDRFPKFDEHVKAKVKAKVDQFANAAINDPAGADMEFYEELKKGGFLSDEYIAKVEGRDK